MAIKTYAQQLEDVQAAITEIETRGQSVDATGAGACAPGPRSRQLTRGLPRVNFVLFFFARLTLPVRRPGWGKHTQARGGAGFRGFRGYSSADVCHSRILASIDVGGVQSLGFREEIAVASRRVALSRRLDS